MRYHPEDDPDFREEDASQEESAFQKQAWFVIGIACLLCAGMILYSLFFTGPKVWEGTGLPEVSSLASGVSAVSQTSDTASGTASSSEPQEKLDLNTATQEELDALPGIGPVKAEAILQYREESGPFRTVEEIMEVKGIGEKTLEQLRPYITVEGESSSPSAVSSSESQEKLDLNTATQEELDALPGIGPVKAEAILQYREESGPFRTVEEIMEVEGIGEKTLEQLRPYITVEGEPSSPPA